MRNLLALLALLVPAVAASQGKKPKRLPLPSGGWLAGVVVRTDTSWTSYTLRFTDDSIHGESNSAQAWKMFGATKGDSVDIVQYWDSVRVRGRFHGAIKNGRIVGMRMLSTMPGAALTDTAAWFAVPQPVRAGPPRSISFEPTEFHRRFSGAIAPALHIFPGDTVKTRTIDAGGVDWNGVRRSSGGNPETGPFYVEGAVPGDVVAIRLHKVRLNRDFANAGSSIVSNALTPGLARGLPDVAGFNSKWKLDRARGVAMLDLPTKPLIGFEVPLRPMMGCIAVAPAQKQAIRTQDSGPFGGNMDYNRIREGVTVYLAVNEPGALVFIGDGHAAQGDGELSGDALETSMDVEFSVDIIRNYSIGTPRAEDAEYRMSIGIAGDLQEALRQATADMARWLAADFKFNGAELAAVLGSAMEYDVADLVGTQMSIVAKMPKAVLARLGH
jgi:amidase